VVLGAQMKKNNIEKEFKMNKKNLIKNMSSIEDLDLKPIATDEEMDLIKSLYDENPFLSNENKNDLEARAYITNVTDLESGRDAFDPDESWIQTYSGMRFNPTKPNIAAINLQDIAHALSRQCRFSGHVKNYYSVAEHSVLVSYLCDAKDALAGLLHDASEAYLVDIPAPLKRSGKFSAYLEFEKNMQIAICKKFGLEEAEPESVKLADKLILATEARDCLISIREDWVNESTPLPFKILGMNPEEAENCFIKRFFELKGNKKLYKEFMSKANDIF
jgi:uncharacterized protein